MILARIEGNVVSTVKHSSLQGWRLLICQPIGTEGKAAGVPVVAIDPYGASLHQTVIMTTDGNGARAMVKDEKSPVRNMIIGIVDEPTVHKSENRHSKTKL